MKKFVTWNVNGIRACVKKGFEESFTALDADIFALQETKMQEGQLDLDLPGYHQYWNYAEKKGYSGTAVFAKEEPLSVTLGIGSPEHDCEGRAITLEYPDYYFVTAYVPNAQDGLKRLDYRMDWEDKLRSYLSDLDKQKPVFYCGDLNVAHEEIDLKNPKTKATPASPTRSGRSSRSCSERDSPTPSATCTPTSPASTPGGPTASTPGPTTRGGASTTSSSPTA